MMPCLSLRQPWASLIGRGKSIDTRSWRTVYRGPIAIHASLKTPESFQEQALCMTNPARDILEQAGLLKMDGQEMEFHLPLGAIVAVATLKHCLQTGVPGIPRAAWIDTLPTNEFLFGDYRPGRYGWVLEDIHILAKPIPCKGKRRLFDVDIEDPRRAA